MVMPNTCHGGATLALWFQKHNLSSPPRYSSTMAYSNLTLGQSLVFAGKANLSLFFK